MDELTKLQHELARYQWLHKRRIEKVQTARKWLQEHMRVLEEEEEKLANWHGISWWDKWWLITFGVGSREIQKEYRELDSRRKILQCQLDLLDWFDDIGRFGGMDFWETYAHFGERVSGNSEHV